MSSLSRAQKMVIAANPSAFEPSTSNSSNPCIQERSNTINTNPFVLEEQNKESEITFAEDICFEDSDDSIADKDYIPKSSSSENEVEEDEMVATEGITAKTNRKRWRKTDSTKWKRNVAKKLRNSGDGYTTKKGYKLAKRPKHVDCSKCRYACTSNFNEEDRTRICANYWSLTNYERQKGFILKNVKISEPQRRRARKEDAYERTNAKQFHFTKDGTEIRVCQKFFLTTLNISNGPLNAAFQKCNKHGTFEGKDLRGKHTPSNKTPEDTIRIVKQHIESFPLTESHYIRKSSTRKYLDSKLTISKMYALYEEMCQEKNFEPVSLTTYRRIFGEQYNYSFFKPRKDQCAICVKYNSANAEEKLRLDKMYQDHKFREIDTNQAKALDKERATHDSNFKTVTVDLQSVLQVPSSDVSPMYYSRKLCCYNFTIYEGAPPNNAFCYCWLEINGKRGSTEIGTCLYQYLTQLSDNIKEISIFSDTCAGQNRNQNVAALLMYIVQTTHIETIEQKYLESGHSMMECDSMHSAIEREKKNVAVYTVHDWINIFNKARSKRGKKKNEPYFVRELKFDKFIDLNNLAKTILKNKKVDIEGKVVNWLKVKCLKYQKAQPGIIFYRYDHTSTYSQINVYGKGRPKLPDIKPAYQKMLPISELKYKSLMTLCEKDVIPEEFHGWYKSLPSAKNVRDTNPEPATLSSSESEED